MKAFRWNKNLWQRISVGVLSALVLVTSTGFAENLKPNSSDNETITNTKKLLKQEKTPLMRSFKKSGLLNAGSAFVTLLMASGIFMVSGMVDQERCKKGNEDNSKGETTKNLIIKGHREKPIEITDEMVRIIQYKLAGTKGKINLELTNCVVPEGVFKHFDCIDDLTIGSGTVVKKIGFGFSKINTVTIREGAKVEGLGFKYSKINTVTIDKHVTFGKDAFYGANITEFKRYYYNSKEVIPYKILLGLGVSLEAQEIIELYKENFKFDEKTRTLTINANPPDEMIIDIKMVGFMAKKYDLSENNKINLELTNCFVRKDAFVNEDFIDNLTVGSGTVLEYGSFRDAKMNSLIIKHGATVNNFAFARFKTNRMTIDKDIKLDCGFTGGSIYKSAKYSNEEDIPCEVLYNSECRLLYKPEKQTQSCLDKYFEFDERNKTLTVKGEKSSDFKLCLDGVTMSQYRDRLFSSSGEEGTKIKSLKFYDCVVDWASLAYYFKFDDLTIGSGVKFKNNNFSGGQKIINLTVDKGAKFGQFIGSTPIIVESAKYNDDHEIKQVDLLKWGFSVQSEN